MAISVALKRSALSSLVLRQKTCLGALTSKACLFEQGNNVENDLNIMGNGFRVGSERLFGTSTVEPSEEDGHVASRFAGASRADAPVVVGALGGTMGLKRSDVSLFGKSGAGFTIDGRSLGMRLVSTTKKGEQSSKPETAQEGSTSGETVMPHPGMQMDDFASESEGKTSEERKSYMLMHPVYEKDYVESIRPKHRPPKAFHDYTGYYGVMVLRKTFDLITGYGSNMTADKWMTRFLFLETVAGVPGMVGGMMRHLRSLRTMKRDNGWIHTLLEEAENERMHLLTFMQMKNPGILFRGSVIFTQGIFLSLYSLFYAISPRHCHAFVSYLEEEAVKTYTHAIEDCESGKIPEWKNMKAPDLACKYWRLEKGSSMRDLLLAIRADEACHNHVNAVFAEMKADDPNPFAPGTTVVQ